ncbi:hypothetical protein OKW98_18655 [Pseudomonas sp. KU26590]|uniref:hypothetical protein n=1 Tax=Pseudomonas sp. KU26590 TaxID=2991051 RepID=UPI00223D9279|nr:hypothetical protein [Pseudomonas sp. KU26590]UZJ58599.1 hypothetical protein OKW98_18655 [Pseudomonas sp. KU26590]
MTTPLYPSLAEEQIADIERRLTILGFGAPSVELPESMAVPEDRVLMVFKGLTMLDAMREAERAHISNPEAWSRRTCLCGEWTLSYEVRV